MTIGFIGAGNMGTALCKAFLKDDQVSNEEILLCDRSVEKLEKLSKELNVQTTQNIEDLFDLDILVIAVKPQGFTDLSATLKGKISEKSIVLSVMAGVNIKKIQESLDHQKIIRSMPNTPALVNQGVLAWVASDEVSTEEKQQVQNLFEKTGYAFEARDEEQIDDISALTGCGPGFFFTIFDEWKKASDQLNIPEEQRTALLLKTLKGSLALLEDSDDDAATLASKVASKGGATQMGIDTLNNANINETFKEMIKVSYERCKELG